MVKILNDLKNNLDFKMESAYDTDVKYSNYTETFFGLLDYIYFTNEHLELIQVKIVRVNKNYFCDINLFLFLGITHAIT